MSYLVIKWLHVLSSTVLFGTGIGSAFYMLFVSLQRDPRAVFPVVRLVVIADFVFTTTAMVVQPLTGWLLVRMIGLPLSTPWIAGSIVLYVLAGLCWLPVVWIQIRMRDIARQAVADGSALPDPYWALLRWWVALGVPAFFALVGAFWLMVAKPVG